MCLLKLPGHVKGLFQREAEAVLLSSGMGEEIVGCLELPRKQRPGLAEEGSYMLWWKGSVHIASGPGWPRSKEQMIW